MQDAVLQNHRSPAVQRLLTALTARITSGELRAGEYLPSAHALAKEYGIGYVSVIRVFKTLTDAGYITTVQGRGAFVRGVPAPGLQEIAVILPSSQYLSEAGNPHSEWVFHSLLAGINSATLSRGIRLQLLFADAVAGQWREVLDALSTGTRVLFIMDAPAPWVLRLQRRGIPYGLLLPAQLGEWEMEIPHIYADYRNGVREAVLGVLQRGRKRAAFLGDRMDPHERPRYEGFLDALHAGGGREVALIHCPEISREAGRLAMQTYLGGCPVLPFDLLVAGNDLRALGALDALQAQGIAVPEAVALLGFDDIPAAQEAGLSTVRLPIQELGEAGTNWFIERDARAESLPATFRLSCPVVWRNSTDV